MTKTTPPSSKKRDSAVSEAGQRGTSSLLRKGFSNHISPYTDLDIQEQFLTTPGPGDYNPTNHTMKSSAKKKFKKKKSKSQKSTQLSLSQSQSQLTEFEKHLNLVTSDKLFIKKDDDFKKERFDPRDPSNPNIAYVNGICGPTVGPGQYNITGNLMKKAGYNTPGNAVFGTQAQRFTRIMDGTNGMTNKWLTSKEESSKVKNVLNRLGPLGPEKGDKETQEASKGDILQRDTLFGKRVERTEVGSLMKSPGRAEKLEATGPNVGPGCYANVDNPIGYQKGNPSHFFKSQTNRILKHKNKRKSIDIV